MLFFQVNIHLEDVSKHEYNYFTLKLSTKWGITVSTAESYLRWESQMEDSSEQVDLGMCLWGIALIIIAIEGPSPLWAAPFLGLYKTVS